MLSPQVAPVRRRFSKLTGLCGALALGAFVAFSPGLPGADVARRPNVIMIILDDQNDWVSCLGRNPDVKTPHIDALAARGVLFADAHAPATVCGPSRNCVLTGILPATSGIYNNFDAPMRNSPALRDAITLGQHLKANGYTTAMRGKVLNLTDPDPVSWDSMWPAQKKARDRSPAAAAKTDEDAPDSRPPPNQRFATESPRPSPESYALQQKLHVAPVVPEAPEKHRDAQTATRVVEYLRTPQEKPFFLAVGFTGSHWGWEAPEAYYRLYPKETLTLPKLRTDEGQGLPAVIAKERAGLAREIQSSGLFRQGVQTYLAAISHQDAQIGRVLAALRASSHSDNTIVILWSDQGFHLGEKNQWGKSTLWRETTHVPFIIAGPGIAPGKSDRCVGLVDIYPTVSALCGLKPPAGMAGHSLVPLLREPAAAWDYPVVTSRSPSRHAVRTSQWCYIRYVTPTGAGEELYDRVKDPNEWHNLANEPAHQSTKSRMLAMLPRAPAAHLVSPESIGRTDVD